MKTESRIAIGIFAAGILFLNVTARAQEDALPDGVTATVVTFYSDHVECYGRIFFPAGFGSSGSTPGVVLANGWTGKSGTLERYAAQFAARGLVAMAIDYRGWGKSGGFVTLAEPVLTDDRLRFMPMTTKVRIKRTRLLPEKQIEDIRNAISYLQGEPGVDPDRIGLWGTSYAGGHVIAVASRDARVKAGVCQVPGISGKDEADEPFDHKGEMLEDAILRARTGQGGTFPTGFNNNRVTIDTETLQANFEYRPFKDIVAVGTQVPILFITAENDELIDNQDHAVAAAEALGARGNTVKIIEIPGITHFDIYRGEPFQTGSRAAADWFHEHLNVD